MRRKTRALLELICSGPSETVGLRSRYSPSQSHVRRSILWDDADERGFLITRSKRSERLAITGAFGSIRRASRPRLFPSISSAGGMFDYSIKSITIGGTVVPHAYGGIRYKFHTFRHNEEPNRSLTKEIKRGSRFSRSLSWKPPTPACAPSSSRHDSPPYTPWCT